MNEIKYLELLSQKYPSIQAASTEIINLSAILNLPKGTEHFLSDLHGEHVPFLHMLKNASGVIKSKIDDIFGNTVTAAERKTLASLIYYPEEKLELIKKSMDNLDDWYKITLYRLVEICKVTASKYTRSKVRKALKDFGYIIDELLHTTDLHHNKEQYYNEIIMAIIRIDRADAFIIALSKLIQRLAIDRLHIIGDIFDRGPHADIIMDELLKYHSVDVQWGNHDIVWMGAAAGSLECVANVLISCLKYNNFDTLEDGYGISMRPLATFAIDNYSDDQCKCFYPKNLQVVAEDEKLCAMMHKAMVVICLKLEGNIIKRNPQFDMNNRLLLDKIDYENGHIYISGVIYPLLDKNFPTIDPNSPFTLTDAERELMYKMQLSFRHSEKLQKHVQFLYSKGSMYLRRNNNLLFHGCIPMESDGTFASITADGQQYSGKALLDYANRMARQGYFLSNKHKDKQHALDFFWYLWCGPKSPLFGKDKLALFERYFLDNIDDIHNEQKNYYYVYAENEDVCINILREFDLDFESAHIINGHVPVKISKGESPVKANGKLLVIDGGLSKAYQSVTGKAGYTLICNSHGMIITTHEPFESVAKAIHNEDDIHSTPYRFEVAAKRLTVADTDDGKKIAEQIQDLTKLLDAYQKGVVKGGNHEDY